MRDRLERLQDELARPMMRSLLTIALTLSLVGLAGADGPPRPVKVFILAGQSNMEGKAKVSLLEFQAQQPATRALFQDLRPGGQWLERPDVWIRYHDHHGKLTVGYGSP